MCCFRKSIAITAALTSLFGDLEVAFLYSDSARTDCMYVCRGDKGL